MTAEITLFANDLETIKEITNFEKKNVNLSFR